MCLKLGVPEIGNMASKIGNDQIIIDKITLKTDNGRPKTINGEPETAHKLQGLFLILLKVIFFVE